MLINSMEQEKQQQCRNFLKVPRNVGIMLSSFLNLQDLSVMMEAFTDIRIEKSQFVNLIAVRHFLKTHICSTDRSVYLSFYSDLQYLRIEQQHAATLSYDIFQGHHLTLKSIISDLGNQLDSVTLGPEVLQSLEESLKDPELPFPKMRKNGQAMFCNSAFQFFLADRFYSQEQPYFQDCFEDLNSFLDASLDTMVNTFSQANQSEKKKISELVNAPYAVSASNYKEYLVDGCFVHNTVVYALCLVDNFIGITEAYVNSFQDLLFRFIEFTLRYCIFRNVLLAFEVAYHLSKEKLSYLFSAYQRFCKQILPETKVQPDISLWRAGMTMWHETMKAQHPINNTIYYYLLAKYKNRSLLGGLDDALCDLQGTKILLTNRLQMCEFEMQLKQQFCSPETSENYGVEDYFSKDTGLYQQILKEYTEYMVDVSVDQFTVHWCGHSTHQLDHPHQNFQNDVLRLSLQFYRYLEGIVISEREPRVTYQALKKVFETELQILGKGLLKVVTLRKVFDQLNNILSGIKTLTLQNSSAEILSQDLIEYDFQSSDSLLNYSNDKHGIALQGPLNKQEKQSYSISMGGKGAKAMIKSSETADSLAGDEQIEPISMPKCVSKVIQD